MESYQALMVKNTWRNWDRVNRESAGKRCSTTIDWGSYQRKARKDVTCCLKNNLKTRSNNKK